VGVVANGKRLVNSTGEVLRRLRAFKGGETKAYKLMAKGPECGGEDKTALVSSSLRIAANPE
jgi:hypothetical protein